MTVTLYHGDCLAILPTLASGSVDAVITDPPYGIGYASSWTTRMDGTARVSDASFGKDDFCPDWLPFAYRACAADAALYVFTRWDVAERWKSAIEQAGFVAVQRLVWDKRHWGMGDLRYYGSQTEDILFCRKGAPMMRYEKRRGNILSVWKGKVWRDGYEGHPTQKPEALIRQLILDSTRPGDTVLDPFAGSGTTGAACIQTGRNFIGVEIDDGYYNITRWRIERAQVEHQQLALPVG